MIEQVEVRDAFRLEHYEAVPMLSRSVGDLRAEARTLVPRLGSRRIWMVNSTSRGGGVAGPEPGTIQDDPEARDVLEEISRAWLALPPELGRDVALLTIPMTSRKNNALTVNALQRCATVVAQNSIREGFGLTVTSVAPATSSWCSGRSRGGCACWPISCARRPRKPARAVPRSLGTRLQEVPMRLAIRSIPVVLAVVALLVACGPASGPGAGGGAGDDPYRLGDAVRPVSQGLRLSIDPDRPGYSGTTTFDLDVSRATDRFRFHARDLTLDRVELEGAKGTVAMTHEAGEHGLVELRASERLAPGRYRLVVAFHGALGTRAVGLYRMEHDGRGYVFSQFEPDEARSAFPCWDEPEFKIPFDVTVEVPEGQVVVGNTPIREQTVVDGRRVVEFATSKPLPTYLVALAVGPLETVPIEGLSAPGHVVTVAGESGLAGPAVAATPAVLAALEDWFGTPYPYEKLDLLGVPEYWAGAMEHPGAVTYSDGLLLFDGASASPAQRRSLVRVTAHELAHMWFGDLVTMAWWDDLWLNESFADWMGDKIAQRVAPEYDVRLDQLTDVQNMMAMDARPSTAPIHTPVKSTDNLFANVGIQYDKGKAVLAMVEGWIGEEAFRRGVRAYLDAHAWGNATAADLWAALSAEAGGDVAATLATFTDQPGYPLIDAEPLPDGGVRLRQQRFLNDGVTAPAQTWKVPVELVAWDGTDLTRRTVLLDSVEKTFPPAAPGPAPRWIMPNGGGRGYYRWTVPAPMLQAIAADAAGRLDPAERIAMLGNLFGLLGAGRLSGADYLALLGSFAQDPDPMVVSAVLSDVGNVEQPFVPAGLEDGWARWVRTTFGPVLGRYGVEPKPGEPAAVTTLRPRLVELLGDDGKDEALRERAARLADAWLRDPASVAPSLVGVALRLAAVDGDAARFDRYRERFETAKDPTARDRLLEALGAFRRPELRERALDYALAGPLRPNELFTIPRTMGDDEAGRELLWTWTKQHYADVAARVPPMIMGYAPYMAAGCSTERLDDARAFFAEPGRDAPGTGTQLARVDDMVHDCARLRAREGASVARYLGE